MERLWERGNWISDLYSRAKSRFLYAHFFGSFGKHATIRSPLRIVHPEAFFIAERVSIGPGARLEAVKDRFGACFRPRIEIGSDSSFEQNLHLVCAEKITIGNKVAVTENVGIFDIWHPYDQLGVPVVDQALRTAPVSIGDGSLIGMGAIIQPGVSIGKQCVIGANSVVTKNVPDFSIAAGVPARVIRQYHPVRGVWEKIQPRQ